MKIRGTVNLDFLLTNFDYEKSKRQEKQGFVLEGGSGSAKTYDIIQFLILYCQYYKNKNKDILAFRDTLSELKKTVYKDFKKILMMYGIYDERHDILSPPIHYKLYGNVIYFSGLDVMGAHGERHDIIWGNEAVGKDGSKGIDKDAFKQLNQRCNEAFILDYNPVTTDHWIYTDIINRDDTKFFKSTMLTNPFLPRGQRDEILKYEPSHPADRNLPVNKRRLHPTNIIQGTADDYLWNVYGLGLRSAPEGLIFPHVVWIDEFPKGIEKIYFGSDIGKTNSPSTAMKVGVDRIAKADNPANMYVECLGYEPTPSPLDYIRFLNTCLDPKDQIWADSAEPGYIAAARAAGLNVLAVNKFHGSIMYGIGAIKNYKLHIVKNKHYQHMLKEQTNYKYREINGIKLDEPIDDYNHAWDGVRYPVIMNRL